MSVNATVLFDRPQTEIVSLLQRELASCKCAEIVVGFMTDAGLNAIKPALRHQPDRLRTLVVGAATYGAFEALDEVIALGVPAANVLVHLGHADPAAGGRGGKRYHPMLHSKVYYFDHSDGTAAAVIGSHNLTAYALKGLNGEASVLLEGQASMDQFRVIRDHIQHARRQATLYSSDLKEGYSWWSSHFLKGLLGEMTGPADDAESINTLIVLAQCTMDDTPDLGEVLYFEVPRQVGRIMSMNAQVHVYVFDSIPGDPQAALDLIQRSRASFHASVEGLEFQGGGVELRADWFLEDSRQPVLRRATQSIRPRIDDSKQQVRVRLSEPMTEDFDYHFDREGRKWRPILDPVDVLAGRSEPDLEAREYVSPTPYSFSPADDSAPQRRVRPRRERRVPQEPRFWQRVIGLTADKALPASIERRRGAPEEARPESGSYVLLSVRRRRE